MNIKNWKVLTGLFAVIVATALFLTPAALAQSPDSNTEGHRDGQRGAKIVLTVAAEQLDMTPQELIEELRAEDDRTIADIANERNVAPESIIDAVMEKVAEKLAERVAEGQITQEEAAERLVTVREKVTEAINSPLPAKAQGKRIRALFKVAAETIGITPPELLEELRAEDDRTIADVANDHDVSPAAVIDAVVDKAAEKLAERVAEGQITQEEADERLVTVREKVTEAVNSPLPAKGQRQQ